MVSNGLNGVVKKHPLFLKHRPTILKKRKLDSKNDKCNNISQDKCNNIITQTVKTKAHIRHDSDDRITLKSSNYSIEKNILHNSSSKKHNEVIIIEDKKTRLGKLFQGLPSYYKLGKPFSQRIDYYQYKLNKKETYINLGLG
jgi:hypothetical protein